jgi:hypothetical protein
MAYEHAQGKGRAFPNDKAKNEKAPHFRGTCNPEGSQKEISLWFTLNDDVDPSVVEKIKSSVKSISIGLQEPYNKDSAPKTSSSNDKW